MRRRRDRKPRHFDSDSVVQFPSVDLAKKLRGRALSKFGIYDEVIKRR